MKTVLWTLIFVHLLVQQKFLQLEELNWLLSCSDAEYQVHTSSLNFKNAILNGHVPSSMRTCMTLFCFLFIVFAWGGGGGMEGQSTLVHSTVKLPIVLYLVYFAIEKFPLFYESGLKRTFLYVSPRTGCSYELPSRFYCWWNFPTWLTRKFRNFLWENTPTLFGSMRIENNSFGGWFSGPISITVLRSKLERIHSKICWLAAIRARVYLRLLFSSSSCDFCRAQKSRLKFRRY